MTTVTFQTLDKRAQDIQQYLKNDQVKEARQEAKQLYQDGLKIAIGLVEDQPTETGEIDATPTMLILDEIIRSDKIQHAIPLHRTLCKTYRLFIELTWYQCKSQGMKTFGQNVQDILANSKRIYRASSDKEIRTKFEYRCAKEAAKCLDPTYNTWEKYLDTGLDLGKAAEEGSSFGMFKVLKQAIKDVKERGHLWYLEVHYLHWVSAWIKTEKNLQSMIDPNLEESFCKRGRERTTGLAIAYMSLFKNSSVEDAVRLHAYRGLIRIFTLRDPNGIVDNILDLFRSSKDKQAQKLARFWEAHRLTGKYLTKISTHSKYQKHREQLLSGLQFEKRGYAEEKKILEDKENQQKVDLNSCAAKDKQLRGQLASLVGDSRSEDVEERKKKIKAERQEIAEKKKKIDIELGYINQAKIELENIYREDGAVFQILQNQIA